MLFRSVSQSRYDKEKTIVTYKTHNGQDLPLPRYYKTTIYTDDQRQLLWLYAEDKGVKWVKGFEVIGANTVNKITTKDYSKKKMKTESVYTETVSRKSKEKKRSVE